EGLRVAVLAAEREALLDERLRALGRGLRGRAERRQHHDREKEGRSHLRISAPFVPRVTGAGPCSRARRAARLGAGSGVPTTSGSGGSAARSRSGSTGASRAGGSGAATGSVRTGAGTATGTGACARTSPASMGASSR